MSKVITLSGLGRMGLDNPASANCVTLGGTVVTRKDAVGNAYAVCVFPNGSECEEWALYRNECEPASAAVGEVQKTSPKLLNWAVAAGAGALAGLFVASRSSKKFVPRLAGAGVGAAIASLVLLLTWPKTTGA